MFSIYYPKVDLDWHLRFIFYINDNYFIKYISIYYKMSTETESICGNNQTDESVRLIQAVCLAERNRDIPKRNNIIKALLKDIVIKNQQLNNACKISLYHQIEQMTIEGGNGDIDGGRKSTSKKTKKRKSTKKR